jgi:agmatine deiminase
MCAWDRRGTLRGLGALGLGTLAGCVAGGAPTPEAASPPEEGLDAPGFRLIGEFEPVSAMWLSHDAGHEALTAGLVAALQPHVALRFIVRDDDGEAAVRALLQARQLPHPGASFVHEPLASFFVRDVAVFTQGPAGALGVLDLRWSQYGMPAWCARRHAADAAVVAACAANTDYARDALDRAIAKRVGARVHRSGLAMEGGGIETNGRGLLVANEALVRSRNPGRDRPDLEAALLRLPGMRKVIWLPEGLAEDPHLRSTITGPYVAWGTGGHTDEFVRFADERTLLLAWPEDSDAAAHPVARMTRQRMQRNLEILTRATDADGRALRVLKVPMPRPVERRVFLSAAADVGWSREWTAEFFPPAEGRRQGQPVLQMATASYLNFVVANGILVLPDYLPHGTPAAQQERVRRVFEQAFPGRRVAWVDAISANWVGGGLHCATLTQP